MKDTKWLINRLKAMNSREILWRVQQKRLQKKEFQEVYSVHKPVIEIPISDELRSLHIEIEKLTINWDNKDWSEFSSLDLFNTFDYTRYREKWNAGFQTENFWPEDLFSPMINISQREDIGDIRTNWELSRHYQFAAIAKSFYVTKDDKYYTELKDLFYNWNKHNLFLHGVEWTSAMELAIRINSWVYAFAFLKKARCEEKLLNDIERGILVMTDYVLKHRARFSSANNHLIVEMYAVAIVGIITDYSVWYDEALKILTEELPIQNYSDGVNKEMSLHYQSFVMEAYGLLWLLMIKNKMEIPEVWKTYLKAMTEFVADSTDDFGDTMEFGDSDEGKILDLNGKIENHYHYVLNLMGYLLDLQYTDTPWHENLKWIIPEEIKKEKEKYTPGCICSRKVGGYTFLRSKDRRVLIGIDHAELGYGTLAAHGHADALSFQMFIDGQPFLVDAGTYNYHVPAERRSYFKSSEVHNTVKVKNVEQAEALGAFLWGKRYEIKPVIVKSNDHTVTVTSEIVYDGIIHKRSFVFDYEKTLVIEDSISRIDDAVVILNFSPETTVRLKDKNLLCSNATISVDDGLYLQPFEYSKKYNTIQESTQAIVRMINGKSTITIEIK